MKPEEARNLVVKLNALFNGTINEDQAKWAAKELIQFERADVLRAMRDHRGAYEFVNWPKFLDTCRPIVAATAQSLRENLPAIPFADVIRQQRPDLANAKDAEVILRYRRGEWFKYRANADKRAEKLQDALLHDDVKASPEKQQAIGRAMEFHDQQFNGMREKVRTSCASQLAADCGMDWETALNWAESVFSEPDHFRLCLDELRGNLVPTGVQ